MGRLIGGLGELGRGMAGLKAIGDGIAEKEMGGDNEAMDGEGTFAVTTLSCFFSENSKLLLYERFLGCVYRY